MSGFFDYVEENKVPEEIEIEWTRLNERSLFSQTVSLSDLHPTAVLVPNIRKNRYGNVLPVEETRVKINPFMFEVDLKKKTKNNEKKETSGDNYVSTSTSFTGVGRKLSSSSTIELMTSGFEDEEDIKCSPKSKLEEKYRSFGMSRKSKSTPSYRKTDYINANFIYYDDIKCIAAMAPIPSTFNDFWQMIWEQDIDVIIMILKLKENGKVKGDKYWPENKDYDFYTDDFIIKLVGYEEFDSIIILREFELSNIHNQQKKTVRHFHFLGWSDFGVPDNTLHTRNLISLMNAYTNNKSILVHCSAGIGRTGSFIAIAIGINVIQSKRNELKNDNTLPVNVEEIVFNLRLQRNRGMVQNISQYQFIYKVLQDEKNSMYNYIYN